MSQIDGLNSIIEVLRRRVADNAKKLGRSSKTSAQTKTDGLAGSKRTGTKELQAVIRERILSLDPDDERFEKIATKVFLESILQWEFGDEVAQDEKFSDIVNEVHSTMLADRRISDDMMRLLKQLVTRV